MEAISTSNRLLFVLYSTVKGSNFGPHGHLGPFLACTVASLDESSTKKKMNRTGFANLKFFLEVLFSSFFRGSRFDDSKQALQEKKGPKFI
jgi:hypothetical protein